MLPKRPTVLEIRKEKQQRLINYESSLPESSELEANQPDQPNIKEEKPVQKEV